MFFGDIDIEEALGGVAVHSIRKGDLVLKKGTVIGHKEIEALRRQGVASLVIARLEASDIGENAAAAHIAQALKGPFVRVEEAFTGRVNLFADKPGVLVVNRAEIDRLNAIDESITFATLPAFAAVKAGEMIGTVKIIPFAVARSLLDRALEQLKGPLVEVAPFQPLRVAAISTLLPGLKDSVVSRTLEVLKARLASTQARLIGDERVTHDTQALSQALERARGIGADIVIVFGASAIADRRDVIPSAIERTGGEIEHFGMPVDPGNLLLLGHIGTMPVLGAPGCARSPRENGFDWILQRLLAGVPVTRQDIVGLGVGGLLMEIVTRPQPRASAELEAETKPVIAAVVLAAGRSTRMGERNKLLEPYRGKPLLRHSVEALLASGVQSVTVVTGHQADAVRAALAGLDVGFVHNPDYPEGISTSVRAGIAAIPKECDGALIALGDMPLITTALIDRMIEAFEPARSALVVVPKVGERRGNPVIWARRFFSELQTLQGDAGARQIMDAHAAAIAEVELVSNEATLDVDTPQALEALRKG